MAKILVAGGAGYVGSSVVAWLLDQGHEVHVLDDLSTGHRELVLTPNHFTHAKAGDSAIVLPLLKRERFDAVMHFAARSLVGESVQKPQEYFENNVRETERLLDAMKEAQVGVFVFSSTCAVFADAGGKPLEEGDPKTPASPYGETKLEVERMLERRAKSDGLRAVALRYFNAAGTEPRARVGEIHEPETHLIPRVLGQAQAGVAVSVFGQDYPTPDGTCVRDYVHVWDLAHAHEAAMLKMIRQTGGCFEAYNLGTGTGNSVLEVLAACEQVLGKKIVRKNEARRPGDHPKLVSGGVKAARELGFAPQITQMGDIVESALMWRRRRAGELKPAVFLDRDGTINHDPGYLQDPAAVRLIDGALEGMRELQDKGFTLVIVSNQSGVGRGIMKREALARVEQRFEELFGEAGVRVALYQYCLHHPDAGCVCRKPKPFLIWEACRRLGLDPLTSYMVGDKWVDIEAGLSAGCRGVGSVATGDGPETRAMFSTPEKQAFIRSASRFGRANPELRLVADLREFARGVRA